MAGHAGLLRDLADLVTPMAGGRLVTCHRDLHPGNVLADAAFPGLQQAAIRCLPRSVKR